MSIQPHTSRLIGSCVCMVMVGTIWVGKSEVLQRLQGSEGASFDQPLTIGWFCTSSYLIFAIILAIMHATKKRHHNSGINSNITSINHDSSNHIPPAIIHHDIEEPMLPSLSPLSVPSSASSSSSSSSSVWYERIAPEWVLGSGNDRVISLRMLRAALWLTVLFFINSYLYTASLSRTSVSTNTIIGNSSCVVVFALSVLFLQQPITIIKLIALVLSITGVIIIGYFPSVKSDASATDNGNDTLVGVLAVVASTIIYSIFEVAFRYFTEPASEPAKDTTIQSIRHDDSNSNDNDAQLSLSSSLVITASSKPPSSSSQRVNGVNDDDTHDQGCSSSVRPTFVFLAAMGALTIVLCTPLLAIAHASELEVFHWPSSHAWPLLIISAIMDAALQLSVLLACVWSSPLFVSIGSLISIPTSIISDHYLHDSLPSNIGWIGITAIVAAFIATLIPDNTIRGTHRIACR